jgi:hypothetical protein
MIETDIKNLIVPSSSSIPEIGLRLYIGNLPDVVTYPCAVMFPISRLEMHEAEVMIDRIQFSCYADYLSSASDIRDAIRNKLKRYYGTPSTASNYIFISCAVDQGSYIYDSSLLKHIEILDMLIQYRSK